MRRFCQGASGLFTLMVVVGAALSSVSAGAAGSSERPGAPVVLRAWPDVPFPELVLDNPNLAACLVFSPGWWEVVTSPAKLPDGDVLGPEIASRLATALGASAPTELTVFVAAVREGAPAAAAHGAVALVLVPEAPPPDLGTLAQVIAQAVVASRLVGAAPDARCSEPLLALAEALVHTGSYSLATLPSNLKPVQEWLEPDAAVDALATEIAAALDPRTAWPNRRARLVQLVRPGGATPALAHAAALLLETSGDPSRFLSRPFDLLVEWRENSDARWPPVPRALRRALGLPLAGGIANDATSEERRSLEVSALTRAVESGDYPPQLADKGTPARLRFRAAAGRRAHGGGGICEWLSVDALPAGLRTGCRETGEAGGFVYARPARGESFEVITRSAAGAEAVLLVWPRWVLFPLILPDREELAFVDREGIWSVALDASRAPRRLAAGGYRHLAAAPDGRSSAAALWPDGKVVVITDVGVRTLDLDGRGGIAWLAPDILLASDGAALRLGATSGGTRETSLVLPSTHSLTVRKGAIFVAAGKDGDCAVQQVFIAENRVERRLGLVSPSLGLLTLEDGTVVGGSATLWAWREGRAVEQVGAGLTPGPGS